MINKKLERIPVKWILIIILVPAMLLLDASNIPSRYGLSTEFWASMLGTAAGVYWTLEYEKKKSREENRLAIKPFFQYNFDIEYYPFRELQSENNNILDYEVDMGDVGDDVINLVIPMNITNIGLGHGMIVKDTPVSVNGKKVNAARQGVIRTKLIRLESRNKFLIKIFNISRSNAKKLKIVINYTDLNETSRYSDQLVVNNPMKITNKVSTELMDYKYERVVRSFIAEKGYFVLDLHKEDLGN